MMCVMVSLMALPGLLIVWILRRLRGGPVGVVRHPTDFQTTMRAAGAQEVSGGFLIEHEGVAYRFRHIDDSDGPSRILVDRPILETPTSGALPELPAMAFREENDRDRLGKQLRLNRELQTGDGLFDARIYIEADVPDRIGQRVLSAPELRKGVTGLLALGYRRVALREQQCSLVAIWQVGAAPFHRRTVTETVERLAAIADNLPPCRKVPIGSPMSFSAKIAAAAWGLAGLCLAVFLFADGRWEPLGGGLDALTMRLGMLLLVVTLAVLWGLVRGHSRALRHLTWAAMAALIGAVCASRGALIIANGARDTDITSYDLVLDYKRMVKGEDSTSYYLYFPAIPGMAEDSLRLSVSSGVWEAANKGDRYQLTVGAGDLGTPWLVDLERLQ